LRLTEKTGLAAPPPEISGKPGIGFLLDRVPLNLTPRMRPFVRQIFLRKFDVQPGQPMFRIRAKFDGRIQLFERSCQACQILFARFVDRPREEG
jgi:hypothetical protein